MITKQMKLPGITGMACLGLLICFFLLPASSCSKNNGSPAAATSLQNIASMLDGEILTGTLSTEGDEDGLALWCNNGKTLIGMAKIPSQRFIDPGKIEHAQVIYSGFGIIIQDTDTGKRWYYIQNDEKSQDRFQSLPSSGNQPLISDIAETIKLNISPGS